MTKPKGRGGGGWTGGEGRVLFISSFLPPGLHEEAWVQIPPNPCSLMGFDPQSLKVVLCGHEVLDCFALFCGQLVDGQR